MDVSATPDEVAALQLELGKLREDVAKLREENDRLTACSRQLEAAQLCFEKLVSVRRNLFFTQALRFQHSRIFWHCLERLQKGCRMTSEDTERSTEKDSMDRVGDYQSRVSYF